MRFPRCTRRPPAYLLLVAAVLGATTHVEGLAVNRPEDNPAQVQPVIAKPVSYTYVTTADQRPAPTGQRLSRRPPHATDEAKVAAHQTVVHHGGRRKLEPYPIQQRAAATAANTRRERPQISESQKVERKEAAQRRPAYVDVAPERAGKKSAKFSRTSYEGDKSGDTQPARKAAGASRHRVTVDAGIAASRGVEQAVVRKPTHDEEGPRSLPSHRVEQKTSAEHAPSYEDEEDDSSQVVEHKVRAKPVEDHYHTASEVVRHPAPFRAHHHDEDQKPSASDDHKKGHDHDEHHEEGGGHKHHGEHHHEKGHKGEKAYKGHHGHEEGDHGHHDKEDHKKEYEEKGGKEHEHHHDDHHYDEHHHGEEGEKGAKYGEEGEHKKGHSTKGEHNVHKKNEYEKKHEFYDEHHEGGDHEKHGEYFGEHEHDEGEHEKKHHHHGEHHEEHHGHKGHHAKGHHEHDHKGHKDHKGHDEHHHHHEEHGKKGGEEDGKHWGYKKSEKSGRRR